MATMRTNGDALTPQLPQGSTAYQSINPQYHMPPGVHPPTLPPLSSIEPTGPRAQPDNLSSLRHQHTDGGHPRHYDKQPNVLSGPGAGKRPFPISAATSAASSDDEEDGGELPASGLVAPWEVLRGLADVAIQRAAKASQCKSSISFISLPCRYCRRMARLVSHKVVRGRLLPIPGPVGLPRDGGFIICYLAFSSSLTVSQFPQSTTDPC